MPRTEATLQRGRPLGVGICASLGRVAPQYKRTASLWSVYQPKICPTTAALTASSRTRLGPRGCSGSSREPYGALAHGGRRPLRNFACRPRPATVEQELSVRGGTQGAIETLHLTAALREFVAEEALVHGVAGQPSGSREHNPLAGRKGRPVPQPIQARAVELGATVAVIPVHRLLRPLPVRGRRHGRPQAG